MNTEQQASELWCPMTQVFRSPDGVIRSANEQSCIASRCAMWRWESGSVPAREFFFAANANAETEATAGRKPSHCEGWEFCECDLEGAGWLEPEASALARRTGYCGLAGSGVTA